MSKQNALEKAFSEFDTNNATQSEKTDNILYPDHEDYEYRRIRNTVICHGKLSKEDASAILLQKTYRMFRVHRLFANYYKQFQHVKKVTMRPYFIAFVLNSHAANCDRRKLYETQFSRALFCKKLFKGYTHPPFEVFTVTNQCLLPPYIDCSVLSQFVKKIYHSLILRAFLEWRIIARKQIIERKRRANKDIDIIKRQMFGNEYVCFTLWYRYTKRKNKKKMNAKARIPQWDYYMNLIDKKNDKYQKSLEIRLTTIKKAAIQALLNQVIERREEENVLIEADKFRIKRNMIFALSAWAHYIVIQHNKVNLLRAILREWFCLIQQRIYFRDLLKKFQPRHSYYSKRAIFSMFIKNRQISQVTSSYLYCKLQTKPSLALFFLAVLTHDDDQAPFYLAMHAWISTYRRRKKWQHFIFQDIKSSNYDTARRKALTVLRKQETAPSLFQSNFTSPHFHQETLYMYEYVMKMKTEYETIFLLSSDEEAKEAVANSNSAVEQRELFFKMWLGMRGEPSLLMRLAVINMQHRRAEKANESMRQSERTLAAYQKAVTFLESYNLASSEKFKILRETIEENNRKALSNRSKCLHRDKMIIFAHYSHFDAESLKIVKPLFTTNDKLRIVSKIVEATNQLTESFQSLVNIASLGRSLTDSNTFSFSHLLGCKAPIKPFNIDHKTLQSKFIKKIKKGQYTPITQIQFERLMASSTNDTAYKNLKTYQRVDPYSNPLIESKPPPITGVNRRLLQAFPLKGRKPIKIGQKVKKKLNFNVINSQKDEGEIETEEEDFDGFDDIGLGNIRKPGIVNAYDKSKGSMFFNSLKSFAHIISQSSFAIFGSSDSTIGMDISNINVPVEEVDEIDISSSECSESERSSRSNRVGNSLLVGKNEKDEKNGEEEEERNNEIDSSKENSSSPSKEENKHEKKNVTFRGLNDGFDEELMKSINNSNPPKSPDASQKTKLFIEILFGRASRNLISVPMMNLKKRLIQELKNQKEGLPIPGIMTQETVMPIGNLLDLYHEDREKQLKGSSSTITNENSCDNVNESNTTSSRTIRNDLYSVNYQSKKYRSLKKKHRFLSETDSSDEDNEEQKKNTINNNNEPLDKLDLPVDESESKDEINDLNSQIEEEEENKDEYEYEYEETDEVDENGNKKKIKRKKKKSSKNKNSKEKINKESSRSKKSKSSDEKSSKKGNSHKNKSETSSNSKKIKGSKEKSESESKTVRGKHKKGSKRNENGEEIETSTETETESGRTKKHRTKNKDGEYEFSSYSDVENVQNKKNSISSTSQITESSRDKFNRIFDNYLNGEDDEDEDEYDSSKNEVENGIDNMINNDDDDEKADDEDGESSRSQYNEFVEIPTKRSTETTSSQNSRLSTASSIKSHKSNPFTPFMTVEEKATSDQNPLADVDKIFYSYLQKNLEEEEQLDLVDLDGDEELQRNRREMLMNKNVQNRRRLWKPPMFNNSLNSHHRNPLIKIGKYSFNRGQPIVIKEEKMITQSMRQTLNEESLITKIVYNNGKTIIKPAKKTSNSQSKPLLSSYSKFSQSLSLSSTDLCITNLSGNLKLDKSKFNIKNEGLDEDQVVTFGGGGRGISEECLNLQRIRDLRVKYLLKRREAKLKEKHEFSSSLISAREFDFLHRKKEGKAKEYEDLRTDFANLRSIVTQLIQMMASSRDDSNEFENLRKRAKFLRKKPAFVGLVVPDKLKPDQFYKKMQSIFMKYVRKKNAQATANELFQVMKNNLEYAPLIIKIIEKTASEERRYIDSKLQRSRLGKQPADKENLVHYIDLDWMSAIPDYKSVALQYKFGFDQPKNLDAIVAPTKEDDKNIRYHGFVNDNTINIKRKRKNEFNFADPSNTNWDRTLAKFELQDFVMISNWVPEQLMDEVIEDHIKNRRKNLPTPDDN